MEGTDHVMVGIGDEVFPWDAFRHESLAAASGPAERAAMNAFWSTHLPVLLSVRNGYECLALAPDGQVVRGGSRSSRRSPSSSLISTLCFGV